MAERVSVWRTEAQRALNEPLAGVLGAKSAKQFEAIRVTTVGDLLRHVPRHYLSGGELTDLSTLREGEHVAVVARLRDSSVVTRPGDRSRSRLEASVTDGRGRLNLTFFGRPHVVNWWDSQLRKGTRGIFVGKVGSFRDQPQLTHPEFVMLDDDGRVVAGSEQRDYLVDLTQRGLVGIYPASAKLVTWKIAECARLALHTLGGVADPWPDWIVDQEGVLGLADAFAAVHTPHDLEEAGRGRYRLLFDEALTTQLAMAYRRADLALLGATPRPRRGDGLLSALDAQLPFRLTEGQIEVGEEIFADLADVRPMRRLLQGEVGSGKTLVALRAMAAVVDTGGQAALLAPTEVLAAQHYRTITAMLGDLGMGGGLLGAAEQATQVVLLTGSMPTAAKREALLRIATGDAGIVIGTHALLADRVEFADLGLAVVDEQHRFGVEQRSSLAAKSGRTPHTLVLTATPIPRSVAMTIFGDLAISTLRELPGGRAPVSTVVVDRGQRPAWVERAWERIAEEVAQGRQAFVVCPRIGPAQTGTPGFGVDELAELLAQRLPRARIGRLHGQLSTQEKDAAMNAFAAQDLDVLVATTVIEVGVDVPNATVMVVWDADRFGISQLHQLRGRIGRGAHPGVCLLITQVEPDSEARRRLDAVAHTRDGFVLAEIDLEQRREGDVLGLDQSGGRSSLRLLRVVDHADLIAHARSIAERAVAMDPRCKTPGFADACTQIDLIAAGEAIDQG